MKVSKCIYVFLVAAIAGTALHAQGNIKLGLIEVKPYINVKALSDSNIYLQQKDEQSSLIMSVNPGLGLVLPNPNARISLDVGMDSISYSHMRATNSATHQNVGLSADFKFPVGLDLKLTGAYRDTTDPATSELTGRTARKQTNMAADIGYKLSNFISLGVDYNSVTHAYDSDTLKKLNRGESATGLSVYLAFSPKTSFLIGYGVGAVAYNEKYADNTANNDDSKTSAVNFGVRGTITPKTKGLVRVGQKTKTFDNVSKVADSDGSDITLALATVTDFSQRTKLTLTGNRDFVESSVHHSAQSPSRFYTATNLNADLQQKITDRVEAKISLGYDMSEYPKEQPFGGKNIKRADNIVRTTIALSRNMGKYLTASFEYTMRNRDSNIETYQYKNNLVGLTLKAIF